jgi:hypothetical protein
LFHEEFYGQGNITNEERAKMLSNPNIYLLSNDLIDEMINSLIGKLSKKYEVNEIYRDEETDLDKFEKEEEARIKRREEMVEKMDYLKKKYGNIDLLYENNDNPGVMKELKEYRREYSEDLNQKYDVKFKRDFRIVRPEMQGSKYHTPEEIEEEKAREDKIYRMREKIMKEIEMIRMGKNVEVEEGKQEELTEEDKKMEQEMREGLYFINFPPNDPLLNIIPIQNENRPIINFSTYINLYKRKYKKEPKAPNQDEIVKLNKRHQRRNIIYANSIQETRAIPASRQKEMIKRFKEYFGNYTDTIYPEGFRHLENFEAYNSVFPLKTMADYQNECKENYFKNNTKYF